MKKIFLIVLAAFAALFVFVGCATNSCSTYTIQLSGNATTGYQWKCEIEDESIVVLSSNEYVVDSHSEGVVGVGGKWNFTFEPVSDGKTTVTFSYARSWEKEPIDVIKYYFSVSKGLISVETGK